MKRATIMSLSHILLLAAGFAVPQLAQVTPEPKRWVIEAIGTEKVAPEIFHIMMKMEYEAGLASDATAEGEKRLREFLAAVDTLKIPGLTYQIRNNLITPSYTGPGVVYGRNIVFTLSEDQLQDRDSVIAKLEDLGARYNSHCVTCIGSG